MLERRFSAAVSISWFPQILLHHSLHHPDLLHISKHHLALTCLLEPKEEGKKIKKKKENAKERDGGTKEFEIKNHVCVI